MAAHEEKISDKRRKLFKALSAAPVVATLHPGSALADSAFNCAIKIQNGEPLLTEPGPATVTDKFIKQSLPYWDVAEAQPVLVGDVAVTPCEAIDSSISFIVNIGGIYYDDSVPGTPSSSSLTNRLPDPSITPVPDVLEVQNKDGVVCMTIASKPGDFAVLGAIASDASSFEEQGVYPQLNQEVYNGMTGTCMTSLADAGKYTSLTSG